MPNLGSFFNPPPPLPFPFPFPRIREKIPDPDPWPENIPDPPGSETLLATMVT